MDEDDAMLTGDEVGSLFNYESSGFNVFGRIWRSFKVALMGTLFVMAKDMSFSFRINLIAMTIDFLQTLSFPFNSESEFPWNAEYSEWFAEIVIGSKVEFYISHSNSTQNIIIYSISVTFVFLNLANAVIIGWKFFDNKVQNVCLLKMLRSIASLLASILYLPLLSQFSIILSCSLGLMEFEGCPAELKWLFAVSASLISLVFGIVSLIVVASFYEQDSNSEDAAARPHARVELIYLVVKSFFTVEFALFYNLEYHIYHVSSLLILNGLTAFLYCYFLPFYHFKTTCIQAGFACVLAWAGICLALALLQDNHEDAGPIALFFVGSICIWIIGKNICEWRFDRLALETPDTVLNVYEVELATRFKMIKELGSLKLKRIKQLPRLRSLIEEIEEFYYAAERRFPKSSILQLFAAQFYITFKDSVTDCMIKIQKADNLHPALDEQFIIYKRQQSVAENNHDAIAFVTFNTHLQVAHKAETDAIRAQVQFWSELASPHKPDFTNLINLAKFISRSIDDASMHYSKLMSMNANHPKLLRMYAYFLDDVTNEPDTSKNLLNRAENLEVTKDKGKAVQEFAKFKSGPAMFRMSAEHHSFSQIEKVNKRALGMLLATKSSVINSSITKFVPSVFKESILEQLRGIVLLSEEEQEVPPLELFLVDNEGYLLFTTCIAHLDRKDGMMSLGDSPVSSLPSQMLSEPSVQSVQDVKLTETRPRKQSLLASNLLFKKPSSKDLGGSTKTDENVEQSARSKGSVADTLFKLVCEVAPEDPEPCIVLINDQGTLLHLTRVAGNLLGLTPDMQGERNITEFIFMFNKYLEDSLSRAYGEEGNAFHSIPTFIISSTGGLMRIRLHFRHFYIGKLMTLAVRIELLAEFNKKTLRFFMIFAKLMKRYFGLGLRNGFQTLENVNIANLIVTEGEEKLENNEKEVKLMEFFKRMRFKIKKVNEKFSPELKRLKLYVLCCLCVLAAVYVGSYVAFHLILSEFLNSLTTITISTSMQSYSLSLSTIMMLLDFSRQGAHLPLTPEDLYSALNSSITGLKSDLDSFRTNFDKDVLGSKTVPIISNEGFGFDCTWMSPSDAVLTQVAYADALLYANNVSSFDIMKWDSAFWVYDNGKNSLAASLEDISQDTMDMAEHAREAIPTYAEAFTAGEVVCIIVSVIIIFPFLLKSENIQFEVISVFYSIPLTVVTYLLGSVKNVLKLMQQENYPESRAKSMDFLDDEEFSHIRTMGVGADKTKTFTQTRSDLLGNHRSFRKKFALLIRSAVVVKYMIFSGIAVGYIFGLQFYVGLLLESGQTQSAASILKYSGTMGVLVHQSTLSLLTMILTHSNGINTTSPCLTNETDYSMESMESAYLDAMNQSQHLLKYISMFRVGDATMNVGYDFMYQSQIQEFYGEFFDSSCSSTGPENCTGFYGGLLENGVYEAMQGFVFDLQYIANSLLLYANELPVVKYQAFQDDINLIVLADLNFLSTASKNVEILVKSYFSGILSTFETLRAVFLAFFLFILMANYLLVFRKDVFETEKKKKLTRSMLIMIPFRVIKKAEGLQEAIKEMSYE